MYLFACITIATITLKITSSDTQIDIRRTRSQQSPTPSGVSWSSTNLQESAGVRRVVCRTGSQVYARNKPTTAVRAFFPGLFRREMAGEIAALLGVAMADRVSIVERGLPTHLTSALIWRHDHYRQTTHKRTFCDV